MSERQRDGGVASSENRRGGGQGPGQATELVCFIRQGARNPNAGACIKVHLHRIHRYCRDVQRREV